MITGHQKRYQSTFELVGDVIQSLLLHHQTAENWAHDLHPEHRAAQAPESPLHFCPSILLSGAAQNGKTHLIYETIRRMQQHSAETNLVVLPVVPPLADALLQSETEANRRTNGYTMLRRVIRQEIKRQVEAYAKRRLVDEAAQPAAAARTPGAATAEKDVALVVLLDHLELFIEVQRDVFAHSPNDSEDAKRRPGGRTNLPHHPAFCTDLCLLLQSCTSGRRSSSFSLFDTASSSSSSDASFFQKHPYVKRILIVGLFANALGGNTGSGAEGQVDAEDNNFVKRCFHFSFQLDTPNELERIRFFKEQLQPGNESVDPSWKEVGEEEIRFFITELAKKVGGVTYGGLLELAAIAQALLAERHGAGQPRPAGDARWALQHLAQQVMQTFLSKSVVPTAGTRALPLASVAADYYREQCGYVDVTDTRWDDIVGLAAVKEAIRNFFLLPLQHAAAYRHFNTTHDGVLRPLVSPSTGMLLYGPPGTGKTMLAKAMATELHYAFLYMNIADLIVSEVGESEKRLDHLFYDLAVRRSPCIIFMDEMQAIFARRYHTREADGGHGVTGAAASSTHDARLVSHLALLLQQSHALFLQQQASAVAPANRLQIIFIGATNHKELIDPVLLSAGRLDTQLYVPPPAADAAAVFVQQHIRGRWAHWFAHYRAALQHAQDGGTTAVGDGSAAVDQWVERVQRTVIDYFVEQLVAHTGAAAPREAKSGADIQNVFTKFGLELAKHVIDTQSEEEEGGACASGGPQDDGAVEVRLAAAMVRALIALDAGEADDAAVLRLLARQGEAGAGGGLTVSPLVRQVLAGLCRG
ncbi:hypothetical protein STCU_08915 [Strigomonas culicis]|uniref:AAA+ ATPase domain-containing protein n=1 Tax=Strigomonas culicis TaxID=28005 RepID=S9TVM9_9TRYP|nr:hypothetical protein STCU_08915 [Strigomonas culicis]|eukprot:EPY20614.1 hypothetical protein STCU_08915 [Strigomonas culicis]